MQQLKALTDAGLQPDALKLERERRLYVDLARNTQETRTQRLTREADERRAQARHQVDLLSRLDPKEAARRRLIANRAAERQRYGVPSGQAAADQARHQAKAKRKARTRRKGTS